MSSRTRKFGRERDQRKALIKGLADTLILRESLVTTTAKAKTVASYTEKLVTRAKLGDIASRRLLISRLSTRVAANKLMDDIAPKLSGRNSGYLRVERQGWRRGDNAQLSKISFVDNLKTTKTDQAVAPKPKSKTAKPVDKKVEKVTAGLAENQPTTATRGSGRVRNQDIKQAAKRSGRRGDR